MKHLLVISREDQGKIGAVTVFHDVNGAEAELLDDGRRVIRHHLVGERPWAIRTVPIPQLIGGTAFFDNSFAKNVTVSAAEVIRMCSAGSERHDGGENGSQVSTSI